MAAQAAGTGASAGAAAVSESDMSAVWCRGCVSCLVTVLRLWTKSHQERQREKKRESGVESEFVKGEGAQEEVGGDKHVIVAGGGKGEGAVNQTEVQRQKIGQQGQKGARLRFLDVQYYLNTGAAKIVQLVINYQII